MIPEPSESLVMHRSTDDNANSGLRSCSYSSVTRKMTSNFQRRDEGNIVLGPLLVGGLNTAFREYFAPNLHKWAESTRDLRGFVQSLMKADWVDVLCENGKQEVSRLDRALECMDTFRTEGSHYTWENFLDLLGNALGNGTVYEIGVGFVVPKVDSGVLSVHALFSQTLKELDAIHASGGSRGEFKEILAKIRPEDYLSSPTTATPQRGPTPGSVRTRQPGELMEVDNSAVAVAEDCGSLSKPLEVVDDSDDEKIVVEKDVYAWVNPIDRNIAETEKYLAEEMACSTGVKASPGREVSDPGSSLAGATAPGNLSLALSAQFKSTMQLSEDLEERIEAKARLQKRARIDSFRRKGSLSREQEQEVDEAFDDGPMEEVLVNAFNTKLTRKDLICLHPLTWLNDEVVNMYMLLLDERDKKLCEEHPSRRRSHFFSSFFLTKLAEGGKYRYAGVRRWTRKIKVFELDKIFCPVNVSNMHWCMAVIYVQQKRIHYYDSMGGTGKSMTNCLLMWLEDEDEDKNKDKATFDPDDWTIVGTDCDTTPQQENGSDCGVFACTFASYATDGLPFDFSQADITQIRRRIMWSLLNQRLV